jgi:hypothetical protein
MCISKTISPKNKFIWHVSYTDCGHIEVIPHAVTSFQPCSKIISVTNLKTSQSTKSCNRMADNTTDGLLSAWNRDARPTIHVSVVADG